MIAPLFKKNTIEQTGFDVSDDGFSYKGRPYKLSDVEEIRSYRVMHQTRQIPMGASENHNPAISFIIKMRDGESIQVTEQSTLISSSNNKRVEHLQATIDYITKKTFGQRVAKYLAQIEGNGYFDYGTWRFSTSQRKIIDMTSGKGYLASELNFLRSYGFIEMVPKNESLVEKVLRKSKQEISGKRWGIGTLVDTDVFFSLLEHFFKLKW